MGHGIGGDEVAAAQLGGVEAELVCGLVDQALQQIDVLGPAGAAIRIRRRRVRVGGTHARMEHGSPVGAGERAGAALGGNGRPIVGRVGAEIGDTVCGQCQEPPVGIQRQCRTRAEVAPLVIARHALAPVRHPT